MSLHAIRHLELAIENLRRTNSPGLEDVLSKFDDAFGELRTLQPGEADSPGRREARAVAAEAEAPAEDKTEPKEPTVAHSFDEATSIAKERLSGGTAE